MHLQLMAMNSVSSCINSNSELLAYIPCLFHSTPYSPSFSSHTHLYIYTVYIYFYIYTLFTSMHFTWWYATFHHFLKRIYLLKRVNSSRLSSLYLLRKLLPHVLPIATPYIHWLQFKSHKNIANYCHYFLIFSPLRTYVYVFFFFLI